MKFKLKKQKENLYLDIFDNYQNIYRFNIQKFICIVLFLTSFFGTQYLMLRNYKIKVVPCDPIKIETELPKPVPTVTKDENYYKQDALRYIRYKSNQEGLSDKDGSLLIRIARAESGCNLNQNSKNGKSTASGIYQILKGTWESNKCVGDRFNFVDNINCGIKIYKSRGTQPWITSKHQKSGNGWGDPNQCINYFK